MTIDSHQHFWKYTQETHGWIDDNMAVIRRDFLPRDLKPILQENNIDGCVAIQADQTLEETNFLLQLANENDFIKAVVGWVDLREQNIASTLEGLKQNKKLKGFRHIVQGESDPNFLLRSEFLNGISHLEKNDFTYDILVFPHQLGATLEFVKKFPNQKFVIDHIAKPYIKDSFFDGWALLMKEIAKQENVFCKLSGIATEADIKLWTPQQLEPYMQLVLDSFGSNRVMYGSDWPVCLVAGDYSEIKNIATDFIKNLSNTEQENIMGNNAAKFYNL
ncbi:amidohydrolase family protein [Cellulophaga baltica]|uniref:amidohydrolase family protein n=1 Tax=Cellulophaga TaxID=104264 RepID=UPI001C0767A6|nr:MULTISPECIES: amidohydrolase family protein [Cellulophaga]MBU2998019.1 amidohydrolase family protein [Cellulophaga baltica]MDO6769420.1 amidohydrolase family protein [Cellulophaga sp. 1_MG-2023]